MRHLAFSLIELLVVITIVGMVSAVAFSIYKNYIVQARILKATSVIESLADRSILHAQQHGLFASANDFGLTNVQYPTAGFWDPLDENVIPMLPYYKPVSNGGYMQISDDSDGYGSVYGPCGKVGIISAQLDAEAIGFDPEDVSYLYLECLVSHVNGTYEKYCSFDIGSNSESLYTYTIPGWENESTTTAFDYNNWTAAVNDIYARAECG